MRYNSQGELLVAGGTGGGSTQTLLGAATTATTGTAVQAPATRKLFVARGTTSSGAGTASVLIDVSLDGTNWVLGVLSLSLTLSTTASIDSDYIDNPWPWVRARIPAGGITGTGASVTVEVLA